MPNVIIVAGPNGAGKTTAAPFLLRDTLGISDFVNADQIAAGLSAFNPEGAAFEAGRIMLRRIRELAAAKQDFAFETTLSSRTFAPLLRQLVASADYKCYLIFLWLESVALAQKRVALRVASGGHGIPAPTIERRYYRGLTNFNQLYKPLADEWRIYDNSRSHAPRLVAKGKKARTLAVEDALIWSRIKEAR